MFGPQHNEATPMGKLQASSVWMMQSVQCRQATGRPQPGAACSAAASDGLRARWRHHSPYLNPGLMAQRMERKASAVAHGAQGAAVARRQPRVEIRARIISTDDGTTEISSMPMRTSSWVKPSSAASSPHTPTQMPCLWALLTVISIRRITAR